MKSCPKLFASVMGLILIPCLTLSCSTTSDTVSIVESTTASDVEAAGTDISENYLDTSLPREVTTAPYEGESYEIEVPDTIDLVVPAERAINVLTSALEPEWDYEQYFILYIDVNPPHFEMGHGGLLNINAKWLEALPMLRSMTGSVHNFDVDAKLMGSLLHVTGKDGLCYQPVDDRPWGFFEEFTRSIGKPYADIFGEGRQMLAFSAWYQHDGNPLWRDIAKRKIECMHDMTLKKDDTYYFRLSRGYTPWDEDRTKGPVVPLGDHEIYDEAKGMTGTPATYIVGFTPQAAINWYRLTGDESALDLGRGLANYLSQHGRMIDPDTGAPLMDHLAHLSHSLTANTAYAIGANDKEMIKWVKRGFEYQIRTRDPNGTGILISDPTCSCYPADMIDVGILLSRAGEGDYWDRVDGWVRNTLLDLQIVEEDVERVKAMPTKMKDLPPGNIQPADGADRVLGGFLHSITPQNRNRAIGCCNGNCSRALYLVWDSIMDTEGRDLRVNLLMNRASAVADLHSYLPYEGRVVMDVKKSRKNILVRIPEWTDYNEVRCRVDGSSRSFGWDGNYISIGSVRKGSTVEVNFPLRTRTIPMDYLTLIPGVKYSPENIMANKILKKNPVAVTLKGNTVIDIVPNPGYPIERHAKYRAENIDMKTVERFVTGESYIW